MDLASLTARVHPFEIQRAPHDLILILRTVADECGMTESDTHAITMTAELSQMFRRKRDGVEFVIGAVEAAFPGHEVAIYATDGAFVTPGVARTRPLAVAAANWAATARLVALQFPTVVMIDIGTTTTDVIPIVDGIVRTRGWTDPDRMLADELLYLGAVRTPVEAIVQSVPFRSGTAGVSAEAFALVGDVHVWRGSLEPTDYTAPTPDSRAASREFVAERLARVVCGDRDLVDDAALDDIANAVADEQIRRTANAVARVCGRHPSIDTAIVTGVGAFIAAAAATRVGLAVQRLADVWGEEFANAAPAGAVALLRSRERAARRVGP
jgi:probable H4MPT-linked C1 transfer pathway protein